MIKAGGKTAVILDLGNVVLDYDVHRIVESLALDARSGALLRDELFGHPDWLDLDRGSRTEAEVVRAVHLRTGLDPATIESALLTMKDSLDPIPQTLDLMHELVAAGLDLYCLSNMSRETFAHVREHDLFSLFAGIIISGQERMVKPDPAIFELLLERFALTPATSLFVDDSPANVDSARRVGIDAYHFRRGRYCYAWLRGALLDSRPPRGAN
ncbi:MAG: HAD family phosphatase [Gammaproteobacteria bacterium]|nr:HAD family phosphatase [Gammaproteobacteria bacterium]